MAVVPGECRVGSSATAHASPDVYGVFLHHCLRIPSMRTPRKVGSLVFELELGAEGLRVELLELRFGRSAFRAVSFWLSL